MILIESIVKHIDGFSRPLVESRQILDSGYLQKVGVTANTPDDIHIRGLCMRVHNPNEVLSINVSISKPFPGEVIQARCSCIGGASGKCKHSVAVLRYAERNISIPGWSCTDGTASWAKEIKAVQQAVATPVPLTDFCHGIRKSEPFPKIENFFTSAFFSTIRGKIPKKSAFWKEFIGRGTLKHVQDLRKENIVEASTAQPSDAPVTSFSSFPYVISNIFNTSNESKSYEDLVAFGRTFDFTIQSTAIDEIECRTRQQAQCSEWFTFRRGRITGYSMKEVCSVRSSTSNRTVIEKICLNKSISSPALKWGKENEDNAKRCYIERQRISHGHLTIEECGFYIFEKLPFIGASPDGLVECNCCGQGTLEVKCPYSIRGGASIHSLPYMKNGTLKRNHDYFYQAQTEMMCSGTSFCDFCIWTPFEFYIQRIFFDADFCIEMCRKAEIFFYEAIMPELLAKYFSSNRAEKEQKRKARVPRKLLQLLNNELLVDEE